MDIYELLSFLGGYIQKHCCCKYVVRNSMQLTHSLLSDEADYNIRAWRIVMDEYFVGCYGLFDRYYDSTGDRLVNAFEHLVGDFTVIKTGDKYVVYDFFNSDVIEEAA